MPTLPVTENADPGKNIDEKLFRLLISHIEDYAIFMIDPNGYIMSWNQGAQHIKGYREEEVIGKHISIFYRPEDVQKGEPLNNLNLALKNGSYESEGWRVKKDGSLFWANIIFTTVYDDEDGRLIGFSIITRDITAQKKSDEKQAELNARLEQRIKNNTQKIISNELRFRQLIEHSYDGVTLFNHNLDVIYRSLSAEHINGWSDKDIACNVIDDLIHPDDRKILENLFAEVKEKPGIPVKITYRTMHKQGYYIWIESIFTNWLNDAKINAIVCNFRDITQQIKKDEEIRKKNEQVENILESITDGFIALDTNLRYTYANKKAGEMFGRDPRSLLGQYIWDLFPDALGSESFTAFNTALATQQYVSNVDYYAPLNFWQENHIYPSPSGLSVFIKDITLRKHNEELEQKNHAIQEEALETQAAILNALPPNIALLDENCKVITVNESWKKFTLANNLGLPNYGIGYNYLAFFEKAMGIDLHAGSKIAKGIKEVVKGQKKFYSLEYAWQTDGGQSWYELLVAPLVDGKYKGAVIVHNNITDRKRAEASLIQSEANLRSVFENTDLSIVLFDSRLNIVSFNSNAQRQSINNFGKNLKRGAGAFNYLAKSRKAYINQVLENVSGKRSFNYETTYELKDGATEWYDVTWMGVTGRKDENIGFILTLKNITEKKLADMEREKITADLVKRNANLEQFTYIISHNLRAPVANIMGLSGLLNEPDINSEESANVLKALASSINNLDSVIIDLNHILQTNSRVNDKIEPVEFVNIINDITKSIDHLIKRENVIINVDFEVGVIYTIKNYLHSIFYNLIINSIKYRRPDLSPVININSFKQDDHIVIVFSDNGKGIDLNKNGGHLFGLYKRFDYSVEGKGMGLFMVKTQVEGLGGKISVESKPGSGTKFSLQFPLKSDH